MIKSLDSTKARECKNCSESITVPSKKISEQSLKSIYKRKLYIYIYNYCLLTLLLIFDKSF